MASLAAAREDMVGVCEYGCGDVCVCVVMVKSEGNRSVGGEFRV